MIVNCLKPFLNDHIFVSTAPRLLIAMVQKEVDNGNFHGIRIAPSAPIVANLCFADNTLFFGEASVEDTITLKNILSKYARTSEHEIKMDKSTMEFSPSNADWKPTTYPPNYYIFLRYILLI
ncbi:hypothetical protein ACP275_13G028700 [Erythranthe tilingii]